MLVLHRNFQIACRNHARSIKDGYSPISKKEVETYVDGKLRQANMTPYVAEKAKREQEEAICWAVRNEGESQEYRNRLYVLQITEDGEFRDAPTNSLMGVRPVMWLDIK